MRVCACMHACTYVFHTRLYCRSSAPRALVKEVPHRLSGTSQLHVFDMDVRSATPVRTREEVIFDELQALLRPAHGSGAGSQPQPAAAQGQHRGAEKAARPSLKPEAASAGRMGAEKGVAHDVGQMTQELALLKRFCAYAVAATTGRATDDVGVGEEIAQLWRQRGRNEISSRALVDAVAKLVQKSRHNFDVVASFRAGAPPKRRRGEHGAALPNAAKRRRSDDDTRVAKRPRAVATQLDDEEQRTREGASYVERAFTFADALPAYRVDGALLRDRIREAIQDIWIAFQDHRLSLSSLVAAANRQVRDALATPNPLDSAGGAGTPATNDATALDLEAL